MSTALMDLQKQHDHLLKVSRTFALTIPLLPKPLDDYISNAYLLCRIADTVEDDPLAASVQKIAWLKEFSVLSDKGFTDEMLLLKLHSQAVALCEKGAKSDELRLLKDMPSVIARTRSYPGEYLNIICRGVSIMSDGMARSLGGLKITTLYDVDKYCYYVAGVVGEFLAALFSQYNRSIDRGRLMDLSVSFGEGLQLTNIIKDRITDAKRGVCFLPLTDEGKSEKEMINEYIALTQGHLDDALTFILTLPRKERGIRHFCLLNICMASCTLKLLSNSHNNDNEFIKISRKKVKTLYALSKICSGSNFLTGRLFGFLSRGLTRISRDAQSLRKSVSCWH